MNNKILKLKLKMANEYKRIKQVAANFVFSKGQHLIDIEIFCNCKKLYG